METVEQYQCRQQMNVPMITFPLHECLCASKMGSLTWLDCTRAAIFSAWAVAISQFFSIYDAGGGSYKNNTSKWDIRIDCRNLQISTTWITDLRQVELWLLLTSQLSESAPEVLPLSWKAFIIFAVVLLKVTWTRWRILFSRRECHLKFCRRNCLRTRWILVCSRIRVPG